MKPAAENAETSAPAPTTQVQEDATANVVLAAAEDGPAPTSSSSLPTSPKTKKSTTSAAPNGTVAKRASRSGRQVIHEANTRAGQSTSSPYAAGMITAVSLNAQYKTIPEEHAEFCARNRVRPSYRGPVFTVEDVSVPCHACGGPVDPVTRVPVGNLFFHANCLQCYLCGRREGLVGLYVQVDRQAVCATCAGRGYEGWVPRQEAQSRGMVYGAIQGDVYSALDAHDRGQRSLPRAGHASSGAAAAAAAAATVNRSGPGPATLNRPTVPGALPPSLSIRPVHNTRNTGRRSFALMERQQYYTQSDNNLLMRLPDPAATTASRNGRQAGKTGKGRNVGGQPEQQRITAARDDA